MAVLLVLLFTLSAGFLACSFINHTKLNFDLYAFEQSEKKLSCEKKVNAVNKSLSNTGKTIFRGEVDYRHLSDS